MLPKIKQFFHTAGRAQETSTATAAISMRQAEAMPHRPAVPPKMVAIGISTGGPTALGTILPTLPADFPLPILIVQHMPPLFTRLLAERLNSSCKLRVEEACDGSLIESGRILIAPGDFHMKVVQNHGAACISLDQSPQQNFCRPAVDVLFHSSGAVFGGAVLAAVLTGMGQDGCRGAAVLKAQGASVLAQDEATSVVWGMPGAVVAAGLADRILPLHEVVPEILRIAGRN